MSMSDSLASRNLIAWAIAAIAGVVILSSAIAIVPETKQVLVVRFGKPDKIYNAYKANEDFGQTGAGVIFKIPFVDQIRWIDKRVLDFDMAVSASSASGSKASRSVAQLRLISALSPRARNIRSGARPSRE